MGKSKKRAASPEVLLAESSPEQAAAPPGDKGQAKKMKVGLQKLETEELPTRSWACGGAALTSAAFDKKMRAEAEKRGVGHAAWVPAPISFPEKAGSVKNWSHS